MSPSEATRKWVENFVLPHGLCPFAAKPMLAGSVRFVDCTATEFDELIRHFLSEVLHLSETSNDQTSTSLITYSSALEDFEDFLDFEVAVEELRSEGGLDDLVQFAHFHPDYRFAGVPEDDPANATNRSPFPVLQLLRVAEMTTAIDEYPGNIEDIPNRNIALLRKLAQ